jgi:hypothetical protein
MKKLLLILLCLSLLTFAQTVPQGINYQAVARDANGDVLSNDSLSVQLSVISDIANSTISWQETHPVTTNDYGLFTAIIGQGVSTSVGYSATFNLVDWGSTAHYLKVEIDYGSGYVDMGTTAFMSVPYSMNAANVDPTDELQNLSISGDTIFISNGNYVIIPGLTPIASVQIGDYRDGGIVFWVDTTGQHGLICDIQDLGTAEWGCYGTVIVGANGTAIGTGQQNTNDILVGCNQSSGIAAEICNNSIAQGFSDWFLPSKDELSQMYQNKAIIEASAISNGGSAFATYYYWSSSEFDFYNAWEQYFSDGYQSINYKFSTYNIRAVRTF